MLCKTNPHLFEACVEASGGMRRQCIFRAGVLLRDQCRVPPEAGPYLPCLVGRYRLQNCYDGGSSRVGNDGDN
jgi:hypothetical protein